MLHCYFTEQAKQEVLIQVLTVLTNHDGVAILNKRWLLKTAACPLRNTDHQWNNMFTTSAIGSSCKAEDDVQLHGAGRMAYRNKDMHHVSVINTYTLRNTYIYTAWVYTVVNYFLLIHSHIAIAVTTTYRHTVITYIHQQQLSVWLFSLTPSIHIA